MTRPLRVLYADPSPREAVSEAFETVDHAPTLSACLSAVEDGYDCVIADCAVADGPCTEVVESIREVRPGVPLVVWTDGTEALAGEVVAAGADGYVPTSAGIETLADRVAGLAEAGTASGTERSDELDDVYASGILETIGDGVYVLDREEVIRRVNDTVVSLTGYPREELVGSHVSTVISEESLERGRSEVGALRAGEESVATYEQTVETRSGERVPCEVTATLLREEGAFVGIAGVVREISDRVEAERKLLARKRKTTALHEVASALDECRTEREVFETAVETAEDVLDFDVCAIDRVEGDSLVKAALSSSIEDTTVKQRFSVDEGIVGKTYRNGRTYRIGDLAADPDAEPVEEEFRSVLSVPIGDRGVFQTVSTEPDAFDRGDQELAELLVAHVADALDRMAFESRLREERDRFAALFENVPDAVVSVRHREDEAIVEQVNPAFERVFGYEEGTVVGEPLDRFVVPDGGGREAEAVNRAGADGEVVEREVCRRTAAGIRDFRLQVVPIETDDGEHRSFGVYTDITDRKRRRERTEVLHRVLRHDLRNGMNVVAGYAELLTDDEDAPDREAYAAIREQADELVALAERIRAIERVLDREGTSGPIDVVAAIEDAIETVTDRYPETRVRRSLPDRADARGTDALRTAILDVVENAVEHTEGPATLEVGVEEREGTITISVADDGPGIPAEERALLEGDREITQLRHTSGLGLWLANWAVAQAGGELSFSENDPRGTVVTLEIPAADPPVERTIGRAEGDED